MRAREQQPTQRPRALRAARAVRAVRAARSLLGLALRWAWRGCLCGALGLLGDGLASCWALVRQASSDAYSYDTLPIKFPIPEYISDTNNI